MDNFLGLIYTMVSKLLAIISTTVWILDLGATRHIFGHQTRFPDLTIYKDSCCTASEKQVVIKGKRNIDLSVGDKILRLSDVFYVPGLTGESYQYYKAWA